MACQNAAAIRGIERACYGEFKMTASELWQERGEKAPEPTLDLSR
jgi:hypothetical protein